MITELVRENIRNLKPYTCARDLYPNGRVLLDANENAFGSIVSGDELLLNRYPDPHQSKLRVAISKITGLPKELFFFGVGSDEIIDLLFRIFCNPGKDKVIIFEPTYGMYKVCADINDVAVIELPLDASFQPVSELLKPFEGKNEVKMLFLCSPNNPTGNIIDKSTIAQICTTFQGIVVVDEAYIDFAPDNSSASGLLNSFENLVILRTFSKAWGLAAIRAGYCIASQEVIDILFKVKAPYTINALTESVILKALQNVGTLTEALEKVQNQKEWLIRALQSAIKDVVVYQSDANFVLIRCDKAKALQLYLAERNIIIRDRGTQRGLENCVRITVGTENENVELISAIHDFYKE